MKRIILGGGLAGLSLSNFLNGKSTILEKEKNIGGLCRSFSFKDIYYDVGPHILFSKDKEILNFLISLTDTNVLKRSNKIFHKGRFVKYPFENDLAALDKDECDYCLKEFLNNPYKDYPADNMLKFFLKVFGEGMTKLYFQPYNEKIWKFDPCFMDTQMVERIPNPPKEDIIKSAKGIETEGYTHQLYFNYPKEKGTSSVIEGLNKKIKEKAEVYTDVEIKNIKKEKDEFTIKTNKGEFKSKELINCMPLHELGKYLDLPKEVSDSLGSLKYNSIYIALVLAKKDKLGNNFAVYSADKEIIFHRLSKLNFLGKNYGENQNLSAIMVEITYRPDSYLSSLSEVDIKNKILENLEKTCFVKKEDIVDFSLKNFKYAYVIYDLDHKKNKNKVIDYLKDLGISCCGRFAEFEYYNMDHIVDSAKKLAEKLNK